ncbi:MAG: PTS sugar transporter subunit IIA [Chlamydiae bacterium]|nr:PTS sugar transporter subunit IIA [Chlamydiota bacterium]
MGYFDAKATAFLKSSTKNEAILELVDLLVSSQKQLDKKVVYNALWEREKIVSTGIGMQVAIPHAKLSCINNFYIAVGIKKNKGIDWQSLDDSAVKIIFLIIGPQNKQNQYLQILSGITACFKDEFFRRKLLDAKTKEDILKIISQI